MNPDLTLSTSAASRTRSRSGSHAVRQIIEEVQPLLALHGHIHESRGEVRIGRTLAINTGSEYNSGHIHGAVVTLEGPTRCASTSSSSGRQSRQRRSCSE